MPSYFRGGSVNSSQKFPFEEIAAPHPKTAPLPPAANVAPDLRLIRGVPFSRLDGSRPLELDLWLPGPSGSPHPVVLFLHGGAWRRGRRDDMGVRTRAWRPGPFARLAAAGFAVACVDYRLSGEAVYPAQLHDVEAALEWLLIRQGELGVDAGRVVVWGESAGGHLASLLALTHKAPQVAGAVVWYGPSDLTATLEPLVPRGFDAADDSTAEARLLGAAPGADPERARAASPVAHTHTEAPPFLLIHGQDDQLVPCGHSELLAERLAACGAHAELHLVPGADHVWIGLPDAEVEAIFERSLLFAQAVVNR